MYANQKCKSVPYTVIRVCRHLFHYLKVWENYTCELASWTLVWDGGHCTVFISGLQSAHWMMVRLAGWITQLSHSRSGKHKTIQALLYFFIYKCMWICMHLQYTHTLLHTFHEDLRGHGTALQARTVSTIRWHRVAGDLWNWKEAVKGECYRVRLLTTKD